MRKRERNEHQPLVAWHFDDIVRAEAAHCARPLRRVVALKIKDRIKHVIVA